MQNVLEVFSLPRLFGVKQLQKLLDEGGSDVDFKGLDLSAFVDNELEEEFVDWLKMGPGGVDQILLFLHSHTLAWKASLLEDGKRPEDVLLDHVDDQVQVGDNDRGHAVLIGQVIIEFLKVSLPVTLLPRLLALVVEVQGG